MAAALPFIMLGVGAASAGTSIYEATQTPSVSKTDTTSTAKAEAAAAQAQATALSKRRGLAATVLTSQQGTTGTASVGKSTLGA